MYTVLYLSVKEIQYSFWDLSLFRELHGQFIFSKIRVLKLLFSKTVCILNTMVVHVIKNNTEENHANININVIYEAIQQFADN